MKTKLTNFQTSTVATLKNGGPTVSGSDMSALRALKCVTSSTPRRLTASEVALLRRSKMEIQQRVRELAAG